MVTLRYLRVGRKDDDFRFLQSRFIDSLSKSGLYVWP
jgi:hypothetical protein